MNSIEAKQSISQFINRVLAFVFFVGMWILKNYLTNENFLIGMAVFGVLYLIYFIISEGFLKKIIVGILISILITIGARFYPPLVILAVVYLIYSIISSIMSLAQLFPLFLISLGLFSLLFCNEILLGFDIVNHIDNFDIAETANIINESGVLFWFTSLSYGKFVLIGYILFAAKVAHKIGAPNIKYTFLQLALIIIAIPIVVLTIIAIRSSIKHFIETKVNFEITDPGKKVDVAGYVKADGTNVAGHTRTISKPVAEIIRTEVIGAGAAIAGSSETIVSSLNKLNKKMTKKKDLLEDESLEEKLIDEETLDKELIKE